MSLPSYDGLIELAKRASRRKDQSAVATSFFRALYASVAAEETRSRSVGDKQALVGCVQSGMGALIECLRRETPSIQVEAYRIPIDGLRGKTPDYALRRGRRVYLIEQKSILRFNEFAQVIFEAMVAKTRCGADEVRFAGLFNYLHQSRTAFEGLCTFEGRRWVDLICVLIPRPEFDEYSAREVDALYADIRSWLVGHEG